MIKKLFFFLLLVVVFVACEDDSLPKPKTYLRLDIPSYSYKLVDSIFPYTFKMADNAFIECKHPEQPFWINLVYPKFNAVVYLSYYKVDTNLSELLGDAQDLAFKHQSKANDISENLVLLPNQNVYGLVYKIKGVETASPLNFYLTDSTKHYLRGALYFDLSPNNDSLAPIIQSIQKDMDTLIQTLRWK